MMKKHKYRINPETLALERIEQGLLYWLKKSGGYILSGICLGIVFFFVYFMLFPSPREKQLSEQNRALRNQYAILDKKVDQMQVVLHDLAQRDDNLYRVLFDAEPIPQQARYAAQQRIAYYDSLMLRTNARLASDLTYKVDVLEREIYVQAKSYDDIMQMARTQEVRMENIPAIQPILNKDLTHVASGFGWRVDPVYHTKKFHSGMDFTAAKGTDVYATGNAKVAYVGWKQGYGNTVILDHGFGYQTLYAHLFRALVREGQKVTRGDVIALVGNTGKSTGPHLHYEVHVHENPVDPRNYYFYDLSPEEYDRMVQLSNNFGQTLD
ncbi:MAG: M23 family metallopeptidase [Paludibacteraceae bacterium]|nr:M23 family metallopeptidase [Paludibacteraceae bacterium]